MNTPTRLEQAIVKLYEAFHSNQLHPKCCKQCAVGNILDQQDFWKYLSDEHGSIQLNYVGRVHQVLGRKFNGYSPLEILHIEKIFLEACGYKVPLAYHTSKPYPNINTDTLFKGLYAVVSYLCKIDNVANVMDYIKLFEHEENKVLLHSNNIS